MKQLESPQRSKVHQIFFLVCFSPLLSKACKCSSPRCVCVSLMMQMFLSTIVSHS